MKWHLSTIILLLLLLVVNNVQSTEYNVGDSVYSNQPINMYPGPTLYGRPVARIPKETKLIFLGKKINDWIFVKSLQGKEGWILKDLIDSDPNVLARIDKSKNNLVSEYAIQIENQKRKIRKENFEFEIYFVNANTKIRNGPGTEHKIIDELNRGNSVAVIKMENEWAELYQYGSEKRYVSTVYLTTHPVDRDNKAQGPFEVTTWNWSADPDFGRDGAIIYNVVVTNNTSNYIDIVWVEFVTYDRFDKVMTSDLTFVKGLSPGGRAAGKGYATYFGSEQKATIRIIP